MVARAVRRAPPPVVPTALASSHAQARNIGAGWGDDGPCGYRDRRRVREGPGAADCRTEAEAVAVLDSARQHYADCAARAERVFPNGTVTGYDHGTVDVEEGATVGGVHIALTDTWETHRDYLYGAGRDGNTVVLVEWESNWTRPDVPAFKQTVRAAVDKLY
ncbi:hypothetical protein [Kitasatospora sp. NPDC005856]|uniref:hypothetical protein n=1 Tax=Kitasatospora sp. NPDC005856 TaxID=3154566 RepID=UPI003402BCF3